MIRAFIAIDIPEPIRQELEIRSLDLQDRLRGIPIRWIRISSIHLTLKFLGDSTDEQIEKAQAILDRIGSLCPKFSMGIGGIGCFPNLKRARVLWIGVEETSGRLLELHNRLEQGYVQLGYPAERRAFKPHLTLGRVKKTGGGVDLSSTLELVSYEVVSGIPVGDLKLYRSDLGPEGARYTCLHSVSLMGVGRG